MQIGSAVVSTGALPGARRGDAWLLWRRPLFLAFILGCGVSMLGSGRFTGRLILDGMLSFAFVPVAEFLGFLVAYRRGRAVSFAHAADDLFATNQPWLWWCLALIVAAAVVPANRHGSLLAPILMTAPVPILFSGILEWRFARSMGRSRWRAAAHRLVEHRRPGHRSLGDWHTRRRPQRRLVG